MAESSLFDAGFRAQCAALARKLSGRLRRGTAAGGRSRSEGRVEFREHRPYVEGDDPRDIDWNALARLDAWVTKARSQDEAPELLVVVDRSGSMGPSGGRQDVVARRCAAAAGYLALAAGGRVSLGVPSGNGAVAVVSERQGIAAIPRWWGDVERLVPPADTLDAASVAAWPPSGPRRALLVVTDALSDVAAARLPAAMATASGGATLLLVLAHEPPSGAGSAVLRGLEGEPDLPVDDVALLAPKVDALRVAHVEDVRAACARRGVRCAPLVGDEPFTAGILRWVVGTGPT